MPAIEKIRQPALFASLIFMVATIPLHNNLNSIAIIIFAVTCAFQRPLKRSLAQLKSSRIWIFPALYFIWIACSFFWDVTGASRISDIERYAVLFFIPPLLAMIPPLGIRSIRTVCMVFAAVTLIVCLICLFKSWREYQVTGDERLFYYHYLSMQLGLNAIFLSCYCIVSITWLLYFTYLRSGLPPPAQAFVNTGVSVFLFMMIFLLSSKLMLFISGITLIIILLVIGRRHKRFVFAITIVAAMLASGFYAMRNLDYLSWRLAVTELKEYSGKVDNNNGIAIRILMWETAAEMFAERPVLGFGVRGARETILERYEQKNFMLGHDQGYHSHNQYLESAIMGGVPALLLLIAIIGSLFRHAVRAGNILLLQLLLIFSVQALVESSFEVQQELVFYIIFFFLFAYHFRHQDKTNE